MAPPESRNYAEKPQFAYVMGITNDFQLPIANCQLKIGASFSG